MNGADNKYRPGTGQLIRASAAAAGGAALQGACGWFLFTHSGPHAAVLFAMFAASAALLACGASLLRRNWVMNFWHYLALALFLPFYGSVGVAGIALYRLFAKDNSSVVENYTEYISCEIERHERHLFETSAEQFLRQELSIQSYFDILQGSDLGLKKALINKFMDQATPFSVALLRQALKDDVYEIRSFASTALTNIENLINEDILKKRSDLEDEPENARIRLALARRRLDYIETGLPDPSTAAQIASECDAMLQEVAGREKDGVEDDLLVEQIRAAGFLGQSERERRLCQEILARDPDNRLILERLCALVFAAHDFSRLPALCRKLTGQGKRDGIASDAAQFWARA